MRACALAWLVALGCAASSVPPAAAATGFERAAGTEPAWAPAAAAPELPELASALALPAATLDPPVLLARPLAGGERSGSRVAHLLDARRARILLRSLTVPGWGQATLGARTSATVFAVAEASVWGAFSAFRVQEALRRRSYEGTARLFAGIDLQGRDEEFRRIVGSFLSSEEYNRLVVFRDAANLYYDDPVRYREYIAEHSLGGANAWSWASVDMLLRYRGQRKEEQRAGLRANTALALAVANRIVSAVHAARLAGRAENRPASWNLECVPAEGNDPTAFRVGVRTRF